MYDSRCLPSSEGNLLEVISPCPFSMQIYTKWKFMLSTFLSSKIDSSSFLSWPTRVKKSLLAVYEILVQVKEETMESSSFYIIVHEYTDLMRNWRWVENTLCNVFHTSAVSVTSGARGIGGRRGGGAIPTIKSMWSTACAEAPRLMCSSFSYFWQFFDLNIINCRSEITGMGYPNWWSCWEVSAIICTSDDFSFFFFYQFPIADTPTFN